MACCGALVSGRWGGSGEGSSALDWLASTDGAFMVLKYGCQYYEARCYFMRQDILEALRKACLLLRQGKSRLYGLRDVGRVVTQHEVNIVVLGLSTYAEPARLEAREEHSNELSETCWVEYSDPFRGTTRCIVCIYSSSWDGPLSLCANLVNPRYDGQLRTRSTVSMEISYHSHTKA